MALLPILVIPDERLREKCGDIDIVGDDTRQLMDDMLETMYKAPGIGLAAPQIGVLKRVIVMDCSGEEEENNPLFMANPEILSVSEETSIYNEGCLSIPEFYAEVERPSECLVRYLDYDGELRELQCDGLLATCVQHEIDHLDGKLFIDYLSKLKRDRVMKKFTKLAKDQARRIS